MTSVYKYIVYNKLLQIRQNDTFHIPSNIITDVIFILDYSYTVLYKNI